MTTARKTVEATQANADEWTTLHEAAVALGISRLATLSLIVKGDLVGQHIAKRTVVLRSSIEGELNRRKQRADDEAVVATVQ